MAGGTSPELVAAVSDVGMHQADTLDEAMRAAEAGADVVVAQGTEGGGHVGLMSTLPLARMVVRALAPLPVLVAGGEGIAAALVRRPRVFSTAWRRPDQDLHPVAERVHAAGALYMHQADTLDEMRSHELLG